MPWEESAATDERLRFVRDAPSGRFTVSAPRPTRSACPGSSTRAHLVVKQGTTGGTFRSHNRRPYLANAMVDQRVGREETDDGVWAIHFGAVLLATFDERNYIITG